MVAARIKDEVTLLLMVPSHAESPKYLLAGSEVGAEIPLDDVAIGVTAATDRVVVMAKVNICVVSRVGPECPAKNRRRRREGY